MSDINLPDVSLSLLEAIAYNEVRNAKHPLFRYVDVDGQVRSITWREAGEAFDVAASMVQRYVGMEGISETDTVVGIVANLDSISFYCLLIGIMRAGFIPFPISPRNPPEAVANLLVITNCAVVVSSDDAAVGTLLQNTTKILEGVSSKRSLRVVFAPSFGQLFCCEASSLDTSEVPKISTRHQDLGQTGRKICVISHSSGTTSLPKPIYLDNLMIHQFGTRERHEPEGTFRCCNLAAHAIPMFHIMGFILIPWSTFLGLTLCVLQPSRPPVMPSPDVVLRGAVSTSASIVYCAPTFLEAWAKDEANVKAMKNFKMILYGGGPVQDDVAQSLFAQGVKLRPILGLTETGVLTTLYPKHITDEGPGWYEADPLLDIAYIPEDEVNLKGVYRLALKANSLRKPVSYDTLIDGVPAFDTKDLVMFHTTNSRIWKIVGRADDQITHSSGEKTNPVPIETQLEKSPYISAALMFGRARIRPGVIISPHKDHIFDASNPTRRYDEYLDLIWDAITAANAGSPRHSRIFKEMVLIADPAKPFEYTIKGSIRRQITLGKYQKEIDQLYDIVEAPDSFETVHPRSLEPSAVLDVIRTTVQRVLERKVEDDEDVFRLGADSLCALSIRVEITRWLQSMVGKTAIEAIPRDLLYVHPTVTALTNYVTGPFIQAMNQMQLDTVKQYTLKFSLEEDIKWQAALQSKETVIEIVPSKGEPPLIVIHAGGGNIDPFLPFMKCTSAVWAIKMGEDVPKESTESIIDFYYSKIKEKQPTGPYRLASYSGSSVYLVALVRLFERKRESVEQMVMLDHCPGLFFPDFRPDVVKPEDPVWMKKYLDDNIRTIANLMIPAITVRARLLSDVLLVKRNEELIATLNGGEAPAPHIAHFAAMVTVMQDTSLRYLMNDEFLEADSEGNLTWSFKRFRSIMDAIKAPLTIYIASDGSTIAIPKEYPQAKKDLGASMFFSNFTIVPIDGDHISFLEDADLHRHMEGKYRRVSISWNCCDKLSVISLI